MISVHKSTICKEFKRNLDKKMDEYNDSVAQDKTEQRRKKIGRKISGSKLLQRQIKDQLVGENLVIAGRLKRWYWEA